MDLPKLIDKIKQIYSSVNTEDSATKANDLKDLLATIQQPDEIFYNVLLQGCLEQNILAAVPDLLQNNKIQLFAVQNIYRALNNIYAKGDLNLIKNFLSIKQITEILGEKDAFILRVVIGEAVTSGDWELCKLLVNAMRPEQIAVLENSAVNFMAQEHQWDLVLQLLQFKEVLENADTWGNFILQYACVDGELDIVKQLLKSDAVLKLLSQEGTPLLLAIEAEHMEIVAEMVLAVAQSQYANNARYTAMMISIAKGNFDDVMIYLKNITYISNNINKKPDYIDYTSNFGLSALMVAAIKFESLKNATDSIAREKLIALIKALINTGADFTLKNQRGVDFLNLADSTGLLENKDICEALTNRCKKDSSGKNILHYLLESGVEITDNILKNITAGLNETQKVEFLNQEDKSGNTPLSYALFVKASKRDSKNYLSKLIDMGAKFKRRGTEVRTLLHMKVLCAADIEAGTIQANEDLISAKKRNKAPDINALDENGMTALHYACMQGKFEIAKMLIANGADLNVADDYGRLPCHYASINSFILPGTTKEHLLYKDVSGTSALLYGLQNASSSEFTNEIIQLCKNGLMLDLGDLFGSPDFNHAVRKGQERKFADFLNYLTANNKNIDENNYRNVLLEFLHNIFNSRTIGYKQKLTIFSCLKNLYSLTLPNFDQNKIFIENPTRKRFDIFDAYMKDIVNQQFKCRPKGSFYEDIVPGQPFINNFAYGIELEIAELSEATFIKIQDLINAYGANIVEDKTVIPSLISKGKLYVKGTPLEINSEVIRTQEQYAKFIDLCNALKESGAKVNFTTGAHVHINIRGSDKVKPALPPLILSGNPLEKDGPEELKYIKCLLANYIRIEPLLRGFLRGGAAFEVPGSAYVQTLSDPDQNLIEQILNCKSIKELTDICHHGTSIDLTAILPHKHGTIEFRLHEGITDPTLLHAWASCVSNLAAISLEQACNPSYIQAIKTNPDIEQLVYLMIAMRNYNETWATKWGSTATSDIHTTEPFPVLPGMPATTAQEEIQKSPFYGLMNVILSGDANWVDSALRDYVQNARNAIPITPDADPIFEANSVLSNVQKLVEFMQKNPGVLPLDPANLTLKIDYEEVLKLIRKSINRLNPSDLSLS